jgi:hypothetical protein
MKSGLSFCVEKSLYKKAMNQSTNNSVLPYEKAKFDIFDITAYIIYWTRKRRK